MGRDEPGGWRERLPDPIVVPLVEVRSVILLLEDQLERLHHLGDAEGARGLDAVIGQMTRWIWNVLGDLDDGEG